MNNPEISIVIPAYNTGKILQETIESVLSQTFEKFELIIVDDGSTDAETLDIFKSQKDTRIRIIHQTNGGVAVARNRGIAESTGKFIAFLDHDDLFLPEKLAELKKFMDERAYVAMVYSDIISFGQVYGPMIQLPRMEKLDPIGLFKRNFIYSMSCVMVRRSFLEKYRIAFDPECVPCDDWDFYCQCVVRGEIHSIGYPLVKYRIHSGNQSCDQIKMYKAGIRTALKHLQMLNDIAQITGLPKRKLRQATHWALSEHHYGISFIYFCRKNIREMLSHVWKAFFYRPFSDKVPRFIWKKLKRKFFRLNR